jgi:integral membrane sensor domain MASE1
VPIVPQETGGAVINGAVSTLIATLCLAGSASFVFQTFFFALLFTILGSAFSGLAVLPVLMAIFQPKPHAEVLLS